MNIKCTVLISDGTLDSDGEIVDLSSLKLPEEPVSVRLNYDITKPVGRAVLTKSGNELIADMYLLNSIADGSYYPAIGGQINLKDKRGKGVVIRDLCVSTIGLCTHENSDKRIKPIVIKRL